MSNRISNGTIKSNCLHVRYLYYRLVPVGIPTCKLIETISPRVITSLYFFTRSFCPFLLAAEIRANEDNSMFVLDTRHLSCTHSAQPGFLVLVFEDNSDVKLKHYVTISPTN